MFRLLAAFVIGVCFPAAALAQTAEVQLAWDPVGEPGISGYVIEYGTSSRQYTRSIDVGPNTEAVVTDLESGIPYFFTVRSYNSYGERSLPSNEVMHTPAPGVPRLKGNTELIWRHSVTGNVARWTMVGLTQTSGEALGPAPVADLKWKIVGTGDFNSDKQRDLVWQHSDTGHISVWLMQGTKLIDGRLMNPGRVDIKWRIAAVADMNGDSKSDLIWQNEQDGHISVWLMNGSNLSDGRLLEPARVADLDWKIVGAGDFNGDKKADLLWRHKTSGALAVWYMNGGGRQLAGRMLEPGAVADMAWQIVAVTDVNADGKSDIIWQHTNGNLAAWIMSNHWMTWSSPLQPEAVTDTKWKIVGGR
jgi:hypothetical protein